MVIAGRDVGGERPQRIEGGLAAFAQLFLHVYLDLVHGHMAGPFDHDLAALVPGHFRQFAEGFQLCELGRIIGVGNRAGAQAVAQ